MIKLRKTGTGTALTPMYIGYIKNDCVRRFLCVLCSPLILVITISLNLLCLIIELSRVAVVGCYRATVWPLKSLLVFPWDVWGKPRTSEDDKRDLEAYNSHQLTQATIAVDEARHSLEKVLKHCQDRANER